MTLQLKYIFLQLKYSCLYFSCKNILLKIYIKIYTGLIILEYSEKFWQAVEGLIHLGADDVMALIEENKARTVSFPENMLFKQILERDRILGEAKLSEQDELEKKHLLIERYEKGDFFIAEGSDLPYIRDDMASMSHPLFALKAKDIRTIRYAQNNVKTEISANAEYGRATIFDKDIWIFAISKLMQAKFEGKEINNVIEFSAVEFFKSTNRGLGGKQFEMFRDALNRLSGTRIMTEIETGGERSASGFGLLDGWDVTEENSKKLPLKVVIELPHWLYRSITKDEVLPISKEYFRLRKPIDRRIYEIARKHCGRQASWKVSLELLHKKTGTTDVLRNFRSAINSLATANVLPDYSIEYDRKSNMVTFINRDESAHNEDNKKALSSFVTNMMSKK